MLKIKDNVDLKELEKFGFEYHININKNYQLDIENAWIDKKYRSKYNTNIILYIVQPANRIIQMGDTEDMVFELDNTIYDLIQAGLVEKIEE